MSDPLGIYIHIPFCKKKCEYCDFYSKPDLHLKPSFISALKNEIHMRSETKFRVETIYFGGGTPSLLAAEEIHEILSAVDDGFNISAPAEITLEANPGTIRPAYLKQLKTAGINRLSIGVQSFSNRKLEFLGRIHTADQSVRAVRDAQDAGFENISLDLIYGLPFETPLLWEKDLAQALEANVSHLSCYMLTIEPGTPLHANVEKGAVRPKDRESLSRFFTQTSMRLLKDGFDHYEISNFAKGTSNRSKHNSSYWNGTPYKGFGPAAHSYNGQTRSWNHRSTQLYITDLGKGERPDAEKEVLTTTQKMLEMIMLGLRTSSGVNLTAFEQQFSVSFEHRFGDVISEVVQENLGELKKTAFCLTLEGRIRLDAIVESFAEQIL